MRIRHLALGAAVASGLAAPSLATTYAQYTAVYAGTGYQTACTPACGQSPLQYINATVVFTAQDTDTSGPSGWVMVGGSQTVWILNAEGQQTFVLPTGLSTAFGSPSHYGTSYSATVSVDPTAVGTGPLPYFSTANLTGGTYNFSFADSMGDGVFGQGSIVSINTVFSATPFGTPGANVGMPVAAAAPEPATWALMLLGLGAVGFMMRNRPKVRHTVSFA